MFTRPVNALLVPPGPVAVGAVMSALLVGMLMGAKPHLGLGLLVALIYAPLVMVNLQAGVAVYVVLAFLEQLDFLSVAPTAALILIAIGWVGSFKDRVAWTRIALSRRMLLVTVLFLAWITLTALWAVKAGDVFSDVWYWYVAAITALIVITTFNSRRSIQMLVVAFVLGASLSILIGLLTTDVGAQAPANDPTEGRLAGGSGDPNYLAAGCIPAIFLAIGLFGTVRSPLKRWPLVAAVVLLAVGLAATESRGGA